MATRTRALSPRELAVVQLIATFKQLSSAHVHELLFRNLSSPTVTHRVLRRLTEWGYLQRVERRLVGGGRGGSGQYVYGLGRRGFYMSLGDAVDDARKPYRPQRGVQHHTLAIADLYVELRRYERAGLLRLVGVAAEPDCWAVIGRYELKPDLLVEFERDGSRVKLWFEVDMATEGQKQVRAKFEAVWRAYNDADAAEWPVFPGTVWVAVDDERDTELRWLLEQMPQESRPLFRVCTLATLPAVLGVNYPQA